MSRHPLFCLRRHIAVATLTVLACSSNEPAHDLENGPTSATADASVVDGAPNAGDASSVDAALEAGLDGGTDAADADAASDPFRAPRTTQDQPDDEPGAYQFHVLYVEPSDKAVAGELDTNGTIRRSVTAFNRWLSLRTGGAAFRFDTFQGALDITYVKLPAPHTESAMATGIGYAKPDPVRLLDRLATLLAPQFDAPNKLYFIVWDGLMYGACGGAPHPPQLVLKFMSLFVGGLYRTTFLTAPANAGATSLTVYSTSELPLLSPPFAAKLGSEDVTVTQVNANGVVLQSPLQAAHAVAEKLEPTSGAPPACRANPFSSDGHQLNYFDYVGVHEAIHSLGFVPNNAPHFAGSGHITAAATSGVADVMYSGATSGCTAGQPHANAASSPCVLDPGHTDYFGVPADAGILDLATSSFLTPTPPDASPPPGW